MFFIVADAPAEEGCVQNSCCYEDKGIGETSFYAKILAGGNFLQNTAPNGNKLTYKAGYVVGAALGYRWCYGLRMEGEYAYRRNAIKKMHYFGEGQSRHGHFQTSSYMGNLLWDLPFSSWMGLWDVQSFIGAGIGYDSQKMHSSNSRIVFDQKWNHFSWQLMAGLTYPFFCNSHLTLEYTFHQGSCHFNNHSIGVGFVYNFDFLR